MGFVKSFAADSLRVLAEFSASRDDVSAMPEPGAECVAKSVRSVAVNGAR